MIKANNMSVETPDCMVYVDAENLGGVRTLSSLLSQICSYGDRIGLLAYGVTPSRRRPFEVAGFTVVPGPSFGQRHKNFVDQQIAIDATEMAVRSRSVKTFVIVSGDADFVPLAWKLRQLGRIVVHVAGLTGVSQRLAEAADVSLQVTAEPNAGWIERTRWPDRIAMELVKLAKRRDSAQGVNLSDLGNVMKQKFGFHPLSEFGLRWHELTRLLAAPHRWQVRAENGVVHLLC